MVFYKSFFASVITGTITEIVKLSLLNITNDPNKTIIYGSIFGYTIAYIAQYYVFNSGRFIGISLLKYLAVSSVNIQLYRLLLNKILNYPYIKKILDDKNLSNNRRKIYQYILINITIISIFILIEFPLRKYFIFVKNLQYDYLVAYILFIIAFLIYYNTH